MALRGEHSIQPARRSLTFYKWSAIAFLFFLGVINFADKTIIGFAAVPIMKDLGLNHEQFGLVGSAFFWFFSISGLVVGRLSDRFRTKTLLAGMASVWAATQFVTVFIASLPQLVATRVVLGAAEGPSYNLSIHAVAKWLPQSQRGLGFSLVTIGGALGPALAAPVLIYFIYHFGWRSAFIFLGIIGTVWVLAWTALSKESPASLGLPSPEGTPEQRPTQSIAWRHLMPAIFSRDFILIALAGFASYWGLALMIVWVPPYLEEVRHLTHAQAQTYEALPWLAGALASLLFCYLADVLFRKTQSSRKSRVYMMGLLGLCSATCWYLFVSVPGTGLAVVFLVIASALGSPGYPLGNAIVSDMILPEHRGTMLGVLLAVATSAGLIAPAVSGSLIQAGAGQSGYAHAFMLMAALNVVASIAFLIGVRPPKPGTLPEYARRMAGHDG
ncbi:MFS transporter [Alloalcanivorax mobilis]|uniref:MFS transporter n=1 Tax=Alloalcanivorax mobilis TaxID=2019569 RepID=UPI000B5B1524|nr:MFS transporter [Alloalcanivorax mobilis]ASK33321.1 hypothetical protein CEK62_02425 [Alcanivorax sp. N3-2A]|tara:strand:+ start:89198 stop:90526 length:1329 start_codon:yes stop_codon:yes gene_type:complete